MKWLRDLADNGYRRRGGHPNPFREVWSIFSHRKNALFFDGLGRALLSKYSDTDIVVLGEEPILATVSIAPEFILMQRSDLFFVDAALLLSGPSKFRYNLPRHLDRMRGAYIVFYSDKAELQEFENTVNAERRRFSFGENDDDSRDYRVDPDRAFEFNTDISPSSFEGLATKVESAIDAVRNHRIFLCHASEDRKFCYNLARELNDLGVHVWYDEWSLKVGDSIVEKINEGIKASRYMGVVLSKHSVDKPWCKRELNSALQRQLTDRGISILPVLLEDCEVPPLLSDVVWADFRASFDTGLIQLVRGIKSG